MMRWTLIMAAVLVFAPDKASSVTCTKPLEPYCAEEFGAFDSDVDEDLCRDEVADYVADMEDFLACAAQVDTAEARRIMSNARFEAEQIISQFQCRVEGETC